MKTFNFIKKIVYSFVFSGLMLSHGTHFAQEAASHFSEKSSETVNNAESSEQSSNIELTAEQQGQLGIALNTLQESIQKVYHQLAKVLRILDHILSFKYVLKNNQKKILESQFKVIHSALMASSTMDPSSVDGHDALKQKERLMLLCDYAADYVSYIIDNKFQIIPKCSTNDVDSKIGSIFTDTFVQSLENLSHSGDVSAVVSHTLGIAQHLDMIVAKIDNLESRIRATDREWYHKVALGIEDYCINPSQKWKIPTLLCLAVGVPAVALLLVWSNQQGIMNTLHPAKTALENFIKNNTGNEKITEKISQAVHDCFSKTIHSHSFDIKTAKTTFLEYAKSNSLYTDATREIFESAANSIEPLFSISDNSSNIARWSKSGLTKCANVLFNSAQWSANTLGPAPQVVGMGMKSAEGLGLFGSAMYTIDRFLGHEFTRDAVLSSMINWTKGKWNNIWGNQFFGVKSWIDKGSNLLWNKMRGLESISTPGVHNFEPKHTDEDVIGCEQQMYEQKKLIGQLEDIEFRVANNQEFFNNYLLIGPSGSGKTYWFEALCGTIRKKFGEKYTFLLVGKQEIDYFGGIKNFIAMVENQGPIILLFDELHLLFDGPDKAALEKEFDESVGNARNYHDPRKPVIIIGATNCPDLLSAGIKRRLNVHIEFDYPTFEQRFECAKRALSKKPLINIDEFDLTGIAEKTHGKKLSDINDMIENANWFAWINGQPLQQQFIDQSIITDIYKVVPGSSKSELSESNRDTYAAHFAGKALAIELLNPSNPVSAVTIDKIRYGLHSDSKDAKNNKTTVEQPKYGNLFRKQRCESSGNLSPEEIDKETQILLAGYMAQKVLRNNACNYNIHTQDRDEAWSLIKKASVATPDSADFVDEIKRDLQQEVKQKYEKCMQDVQGLLQQNKEKLTLLAFLLKESGTLNDTIVKTLLNTDMNDIRELFNSMNQGTEN